MVNGELPDGWQMTTLGEATKPMQKRVNPQDYPDLPYIGMENVEAHTMRLLGTVPSKEMKSTADSFSAGDVLYGRLRPYLNKVYLPDFDGLCSTEFIVFRKVPHLYSKYLQYFLNSWEFVQFSNSLNAGDRPRVKFEQFADYSFPVPSLPEQERIVAKIEELFTQLEAGTSALERVQAGLRRYKASVLKAAVEGKLLKDESGRMKDEGELPEGWRWVQISAFLDNKRGAMKTGPFGSLLKKHEHRENGVPVVGIENIKNMEFVSGSKIHITEEKADQLAGYDLQPGDIVISRSGTVGEVAVIPDHLGNARMSTNIMRVCLDKSVMLPKYFTFLFNGSPAVLDQVAELCKGSTRNFLNQHILKSINFPLPPLEEQRRIVAEVERRLSVAREVESVVEKALVRASRLRQAVLKSAFEGKLT